MSSSRSDQILDFGFWILDCRQGQGLGPSYAFVGPIQNPKSKIQNGFTLIELLVVLIALVIVAAAVVPTLRGAGHEQDLTEVAARVAASARFARDEAVARQETIVLTVETAPAGYPQGGWMRLSVDTQGMASSSSRPSALALPSAFALVPLPTLFQARLQAVPETFNGSAPATPASGGNLEALRFPPDGRTAGGMVVLTDKRGRTLHVAVTPDTGVVQVESSNG